MSFKRFPTSLLAFMLMMGIARADVSGGLTPGLDHVGVMIEKHLNQATAWGSGVLLNDHLVLTAAHVVNREAYNPVVTVIVDGWRITGQVVQTGTDGLDLALVRINPKDLPTGAAVQSPVSVCRNNPGPAQPVVVMAKGEITRTSTYPEPFVYHAPGSGRWTNVLTNGYPPGNSGGGVFDPVTGCLWGIVYLELGGPVNGRQILLTVFVPASQIAPFVGQ